MKRLLLIILLLGCSTEPEDEFKITIPIINSSSILIQLSENVSFTDFDADTMIETIIYNQFSEEYESEEIQLGVIKIESSNYIKLNNEPQSLWYDNTTFSCALIQRTTLEFPDGGIGGYDSQIGENILSIGNDFTYSFNITENSDELNDVSMVPNPYLIASGFNNEDEYIEFYNNFHLYELLVDKSYLETAYSQVRERADAMDEELSKQFLSYPIPKAITEEWDRVKG